MKAYPAIATIEFRDIPTGAWTADAMIKKAPIAALQCGIISDGRYLILVGGTPAAVEESYSEGLFLGKENILDHVFLPDVHPALHDALLLKKRNACRGEALAVLETQTVSCNVRAVERALKGTPVVLVELRAADPLLNGKAVSMLHGALHDIQSAVELSADFLREQQFDVQSRILTAPHEALALRINAGTSFEGARVQKLGGEKLS